MKELAANVKQEPERIPETQAWEEPDSPIVISDGSDVQTYGYSCYESMLMEQEQDERQAPSVDIADDEPAQREGRTHFNFNELLDDQPEDIPPEEIAGRSYAYQNLRKFLLKK